MSMKRVAYSLSRIVVVIFVVGAVLAGFTAQNVITSLKPETNFEDLLETDPKAGMYVKGEVQYAIDYFAYEETWKENKDGSRTPAKTSHYYYTIPGNGDIWFGLEVKAEDKADMEALVDETYDYMYGGDEPTTKVMIEGRMTKMDDEMEGLFNEYLRDMGYTAKEISDMGEPLYVEKVNMQSCRIMFLVGVALILVAVLIFVIRFKKSKSVFEKQEMQQQQPEMWQQDMQQPEMQQQQPETWQQDMQQTEENEMK